MGSEAERHAHLKAYGALASVCFFWGTTYIAIRMALESFPPLVLISSRFLISGVLMLGILRWRGLALPKGRELLLTAANGILILGVGNGCLVYSERLIPSSLAALFIAASPFWMVGLEAAIPGGEKPRPMAGLGMLLGLGGALLLIVPNLVEKGLHGAVWQGFLLLQLGSASWSLGSIWQRRQPQRAHPIASGAVQQLAAGLAFSVPALVSGDFTIHWSARGASAAVWLVLFGSIVGYSSYIYILDKLPVAMISVYTYVNPIVAAVLGLWFYGEPFGWPESAAMAVIFCGVGLVKRYSHAAPATSSTRRTQPAVSGSARTQTS